MRRTIECALGWALLLLFVVIALVALAPSACASLTGAWVTANGEALLQLTPEAEGDGVRVRLLAVASPLLAPNTPALDSHNPDPALRRRPLAGLHLGVLEPRGDEYEGRLYDPESGRTYSVATTARSPSVLRLRAWVGLRVLGRSLLWVRPDRWRARTDALLATAEEAAR